MKKITFLVVFLLSMFQFSYGQDVSIYSFSQSNGTYTALTGGTVLGDAASDDQRFVDPAVPLGGTGYTGVGFPIGFNFTYNGFVYDRFAVNANGWIALGSSTLTPSVNLNTTSAYTPLASTSTAVPNDLVARIAALGRDLQSQTGGDIRFELQGTSPNQVLVVQWSKFRKYLATGDSFDFQIRLNETTNIVEIVYGTMISNATATTVHSGLRANPNTPATSFNSRTTTTDWSASTASVAATGTMALSDLILPTSGLTFAWAPPPACSGTPDPGNTVSSTASACNSVAFSLSLQNAVPGSGISYQWQTSADGVTYTNASGTSTNPTYTASQAAVTYYQCVVTCAASGISATSTPVMVGMNAPTTCYCIPTIVYGCGDGDVIARVILNTLDNDSGTGCPSDPVPGNQGAGLNGPGYSDYTTNPLLTTTLQAGSSYNCTVYAGQYTEGYAAWIDYNDDGIFDNATERIGFSAGQVAGSGTAGVLGSSATFPIALACNPPLGDHRLRVRAMFAVNGSAVTPCGDNNFGEIEDYTVTISAAVACPQPSVLAAANITTTTADLSWNIGCAETAWNVHVTTAGDGQPTGAPSNPGVSSPFTVTGLTPATDYEFYVQADCAGDGTSLWTGPFTFTTMALPPANDDCSGAVALTVGHVFADNAVVGTNDQATDSAPPAPGCASFAGGDIWYSVVVPDSGSITIESNPAVGSPITDTGLAVYSGDCSGLTLIECDDDDSASGFFSLVSLTGLTPGETLYVNVWEYGGGTIGEIQMSAYDCPSTTPAPTGDASQVFCGSAIIADLVVNETTPIQWYDAATGGNLLSATDALVDGVTYYATQTIDCESFDTLAVTAIVSDFPVVVNSDLTNCDDDTDGFVAFNLTDAEAAICSESGVTFAYFESIIDVDSNTNAIVDPTSYINTSNPQTVYVRVENANGCYSIAELTLNVSAASAAPTGSASQTYCDGTVASLQATGANILWYDAATGGNLLASTDVLADGVTYYASQNDNGCESMDRLAVTVTVLCYCTPTYTNGTIDGDLISNIEILGTTLANNTGTTAGGPSYTYYTAPPASNTATLQAGNSYTVSVTIGAFGGQQVAVWIDYNDNFIFEPSEKVGYTTTGIGANGTATFNITLSCNPALGMHRMRVRDAWATAGATMDPCANYGWGETEDYDITIAAAVACPQPSNLGASNITSTSADLTWNVGCAETAWNLHLTTAGGGAPTGAPSNPNVSSPFSASGLTPSTDYEFYVQADCDANGTSLWTGPYTFTTAATPPLNDDCGGAIALTAGGVFADYPVTGTNDAATDSAPPAPGCAAFAGGDVWYSVTVPASGNITIETNPAAGSPITDTGMAVYSGDCSTLTLVSCDDDSSASGFFSLVTLTGRTPGEVLYVNVWEYAGGTIGEFQVSAYDASLANGSFDSANFVYYPNPVKDLLNLSYSQNITKVQVINLLGQEVISKSMNATQSQIDMTNLPTGTYLVKVTSDDLVKTIKVIKQ